MSELGFSLESYRRQVRQLARDKAGEIFHNGGLAQAKVVVDEMLNTAQTSVHIYSDCLGKGAYGVKQFEAVLERGAHPEDVKIVVANTEEFAKSDLATFLREKGVHVRKAQRQDIFDKHFMIVDGNSYRVEHNTDAHEAFFAFNDKEIAKKWEELFTILYNDLSTDVFDTKTVSKPIPSPH